MSSTRSRSERRFGFPFSGTISTVRRNELPLSALGEDSREILMEPGRVPELGKAKRRHGAAVVSASTGALEMAVANATMKGAELFECPTAYAADGYPVLAGLFVDESKRFGQLWLRDGSTDYTLGEEFSSTHWPTAASTANNLKMPPLPYDGNGATGYMRMAFEENRRRSFAGTRRHVGVKEWEYFGGFYATPARWNRAYNLNTGSGSNNNTVLPTGLIPPLSPPSFPAASYPTRKSTAAAWAEGDTFFATVAFEDEYGNVSFPFIPRDKSTLLTAGLGLVTVDDDADGTAEYFDYIPWRNVPVGPPGTVKRRLYRSLKKTKAEVTAGGWPSLFDDDVQGGLYLCGIIENNVQTSYNDYRGNDLAIGEDLRLRTDQVWPSRGRYNWTFDQRHATGYLRPNPCAIILAPTGLSVSRDLVGYSSDDTPGAAVTLVRITQSTAGVLTLRLRYLAGTPGAPVETTITLGSTDTLQTIVDTINATTTASTGKEWAAQLVPGADGDAPADQLAPTSVDYASVSTTSGSPTITATAFTDVAEGMKISGTGITAGTYVKSKSGGSITMSDNATASGTVTLTFYADTGDDAHVTDGTVGNIRCFQNSYPAIIGFKQSYLDRFTTEKRDVMVTAGGTTQRPYGANLFHVSPGGRHTVGSDAGIFMGGAPLNNGCVLFYSRQTYILKNQRSGSTGEDADYHVYPLDLAHGCKSPYSIVSGNGWAGCLRDDGFFITDGERSAIISGTVFDPATGRGEWNYEAKTCAAAAQADTNDYGFSAHYADGRLWVNYRVDGAGNYATMCYDARTSIEAGGVAQMLAPDGVPYGWSARCRYSWRSLNAGTLGVIGSARKSDGLHLYQCDDRNDKTSCGLVQEFETTGTWTDGSDPVQFTLHTATDMLGGLAKGALANLVTFLYRFISTGSNTVTVTYYRSQQRTSSSTHALPRTSGDFFTRKPLPPPLKTRSAGEVLEIKITGGANAGDEDFELSGIACEADALESRT